MPLPPTFTEKHKLKSVSKERKCRSEDNIIITMNLTVVKQKQI